MNNKGFIWIFFKKEVLGFIIGLAAATAFWYFVGRGIIPLSLGICS